jgi:hypothetical protein
MYNLHEVPARLGDRDVSAESLEKLDTAVMARAQTPFWTL